MAILDIYYVSEFHLDITFFRYTRKLAFVCHPQFQIANSFHWLIIIERNYFHWWKSSEIFFFEFLYSLELHKKATRQVTGFFGVKINVLNMSKVSVIIQEMFISSIEAKGYWYYRYDVELLPDY